MDSDQSHQVPQEIRGTGLPATQHGIRRLCLEQQTAILSRVRHPFIGVVLLTQVFAEVDDNLTVPS